MNTHLNINIFIHHAYNIMQALNDYDSDNEECNIVTKPLNSSTSNKHNNNLESSNNSGNVVIESEHIMKIAAELLMDFS